MSAEHPNRQMALALQAAGELLSTPISDGDTTQAPRIWMQWLRTQDSLKPAHVVALAEHVGKGLSRLDLDVAQTLTPMLDDLLSRPTGWLLASADDFLATTAREWLLIKGAVALPAVAVWMRAAHARLALVAQLKCNLLQTWDQLLADPDLLGLSPGTTTNLAKSYPETSFHLAKRASGAHAAGQLGALDKLTALLPLLDSFALHLGLGMAVDTASLRRHFNRKDSPATKARKLDCARAFSEAGGNWLHTFNADAQAIPLRKARTSSPSAQKDAPLNRALTHHSSDMCELALLAIGPEAFWARASDHCAPMLDAHACRPFYAVRDALQLIPLLSPLPGMPVAVAMSLAQAACSFSWDTHFLGLPGDLRASLNIIAPILAEIPLEERDPWKLGGFAYVGSTSISRWPMSSWQARPVHHWIQDFQSVRALREPPRGQSESGGRVLIEFMRQARFHFPWKDTAGLEALGPEVASWFEAWHLDSLTLNTERSSRPRASRL